MEGVVRESPTSKVASTDRVQTRNAERRMREREGERFGGWEEEVKGRTWAPLYRGRMTKRGDHVWSTGVNCDGFCVF